MKLKATGTPGAGDTTDVIIHNMSTSGLLLETNAKLSVGQKIVIDLPETDRREATVIWGDGTFFGCSFERALTAAAMSAAQLRSEPRPPVPSAFDAGPEGLAGDKSETFGARLKGLRKERGLTLVELAHRMQVSRPTVWSWEVDKSAPRRAKLKALADVLDVTVEQLLGLPQTPELSEDSPVPAVAEGSVSEAIRAAKKRIAEAVGTSPEKITVTIEL